MVFVIIVMAELFAFLVVLVTQTNSLLTIWEDLGFISLYVQWCALTSCYLLCAIRPLICRYSVRIVTISAYATVLLVVFVLSEIAYWYIYPVAKEQFSHTSFISRAMFISFILTGPILRYYYIQYQWKMKVQAEAEARLQSLQARIRPHFFFNSLNTIASLTRTDAEQAELAVQDLADLFRASLRDARQFHSFVDEINLCTRYLQIEKLRLGDRLALNWDVKSIPEDAYTPPLLIQPLLENAVYHGIEPRIDGGTIDVNGRMEKNTIRLTITNPLPLDKESSKKGNRIAQENIRDRLQTLFDNRGDLTVDETEDNYRVVLTWPYRNKNDEDTDR